MSAGRQLSGMALAALAAWPSLAGAQSSPSAYTYATRYDAQNRVTGTIAPDPDGSGSIKYAATRTTYDAAGRAIRVEKGELASWHSEGDAPSAWSDFQAFGKVETGYDAIDRKTVEATWGWNGSAWVESAVTQYSYDSQGRLDCTAVRMNPAEWGSLPGSACTPGTAGSYGTDRITRNVYDAAGQVLQVQKAYGTSLQQDYATYTYSANGKQQTVKDAAGNVSGYSYDGFDRLVKWAFPSPTSTGTVSTTDYEAYTYDANGNRLSLRKRDTSVIGYNYDALSRMTVKDIPGSTVADVYYGYDLRGLQTYARFASASGVGLTNGYDGFGRLTSAGNTLSGTALTLGYQYDADGNRTRVTHPDATYFAFSYDGLDRQTTVLENGATNVATISYDNQGRRSGDTRGAVSTAYGYDPVSRPTSITDDLGGTADDVTTTFAYSPANQIVTKARSNTAYAFTGYVSVSRAYGVNGLNQYTTAGAATFGYDPNGNLTGDGAATYGYDVENRMVTRSGGLSIAYDPAGRLWQTSGGTSGTTRYLYDGDELAVEYDGSGTVLRRYVHGPGDDDPILWYEGAGVTDRRSLQADQQGSIVSIANAGGSRLTIDSYDEYGIPGSGNAGRFQYTGQAWLPDLGMYYYKARLYSPTLGRFMQTDPVGYDDGPNWYGYLGSDPINGRDPTGLDTVVTVQKYGVHAYVVLRDTESSRTVIVRGGPSDDYLGHYFSPGSAASSGSSSSGGSSSSSSSRVSSGIASGTSVERSQGSSSGSSGRGGLNLVGEVRTPNQSLDRDIYDSGNSTVLGSATVAGNFSDTLQAANTFTNSVNSANIDYRLLGQNSNSFAGTAFEQITGQSRPGNPDWKPLPAYLVDICKRGVQCQ